MPAEGVCQHEDCTGWCYQRQHVIHGSDSKVDTVEQYGNLFTLDGRRYPDQVPPSILDRIYVPLKFQHLVPVQGPSAPPPPLDLESLSELEALGEPVDDSHETVQLARGIKQRQPKPNTTPQKIGR